MHSFVLLGEIIMSICILQGQPVDKVDCKSCFFLIAIARRIFPFSAEPKENLYSDKINAWHE